MDIEHNERARDLWQRAKLILDEVLDAEPEQRHQLLALRCDGDSDLRQEVEDLLATEAAMATASFIEKPAVSLHNLAPEPSLVGEQVGPYEVLEEIGRGGMGTVYLAVRKDDFQRRVALKVIRRGLDTEAIVGRFHNERQILANLEHPNIARLYDGASTTDGRPYLVMEHVEGAPIDAYCDQRHLTTRERLELICKVCDAVQAAHQNLVVHRDLKPSNILVTADGNPKLLDFGIAKLVDPEVGDLTTQLDGGPRAFTPEYASPEHVNGLPVTASSDVYSLGVLLYELLTGHRPYEFASLNPVEISRIVCEQQPRLPSTVVGRHVEITRHNGTVRALTPEGVSRTRDGDPRILRRRLAGDVDAIVLKALRKEPEQRYGTAAELARDLRRHLRGMPVRARKGTTSYRAGKFLRRRWKEIAAAAVVLTLVGFAGAQVLARQQGEERTEEFYELFKNALQRADPSRTGGQEATLRDFLDATSQQILASAPTQSDLTASLLGTIGRIYTRSGDRSKGLELQLEGLRIRRATLRADDPDLAYSLLNLGLTLGPRNPQTRELADEALRILKDQTFSTDDEKELQTIGLSLLAAVEVTDQKFDQAENLNRQALAIKIDLFGEESLEVATTYNNLGEIYFRKGDYERARLEFERALEIRQAQLDARTPHVARSLNNLGLTLTYLSPAAGEEMLRETVSLRRVIFPDSPRTIASALANLGVNFRIQGQLTQAEQVQREALDMVGGPEGASTKILLSLAETLVELGQPLEAEQLALRAVDKDSGTSLANAQSLLGEIRAEQGRLDEAIPLLRESWQTLDNSPLLDTAIEVRRARERMIRYGLLEEEPDKDRPAMPTQV